MDDERWELESSSTHCWTCGWPRQEELWWKWTDTPPVPRVDGPDRFLRAIDEQKEWSFRRHKPAKVFHKRELSCYSRGLIVKSLDLRHLFDLNVWQVDGEDVSNPRKRIDHALDRLPAFQRRVLESSDAFGTPDTAIAYSLSKKKRWVWGEQLETADFSEQLARGNVETVVGMSEDPAFSSLYTDPQLFFPSSHWHSVPADLHSLVHCGETRRKWESRQGRVQAAERVPPLPAPKKGKQKGRRSSSSLNPVRVTYFVHDPLTTLHFLNAQKQSRRNHRCSLCDYCHPPPVKRRPFTQDDLEWEHEPLDCWEDDEWAEDPPTERPPPMTLADHLPPDFFDLLLLSTFELVDRPRTTSSLSSDFELVQ
ncbi:hypothetical protein M3Y99_01887000 [Aphelenchoides fujianensis]|nr:hypothetical protein M3Y99_01887000 [Aphelenchoides fujianensis]